MHDSLADSLAAIAAEVGTMALARQQEEFARWEKVPGHPVCQIDIDADTLLRERLSALDPEAGWLSEETVDSAERLLGPRVWVVDPIDGTRDYLRGRSGWAISIALVEGGQPVIGVLDAPGRGERWRAEAGKGATLNGQPIQVTARDTLAGSRVPADALPKVDADLVAVDRPNSIALRIALVAAGRADLVAALRWGHEWDIAAAVLIAREAGAIATDAIGQPLRFNSTSAEAFGVLVTAPGIHTAAVERLAERAATAIIR